MRKGRTIENGWILAPYTAIDGIPTMSDSFIMGLYEKMEDEGVVHKVFVEGSVKNKEDFLYLMKFRESRLFVLIKEGTVGGFYYLNHFGAKSAKFHFCLYSILYGKDSIEISKKAVRTILETRCGENYLYDMLYGVIPESNKIARNWARRMGFELLGMMPSAVFDEKLGRSVPGEYFYVERGKYNEQI
jgi:hypothetical protein